MLNDQELWLGYDSSDPAELAELSFLRNLLDGSASASRSDAAARIEFLRKRVDWHHSSWWQLDSLKRNQFDYNGKPIAEAMDDELTTIRLLGRILGQLDAIEKREASGAVPLVIRECNDAILSWLAVHPEDMYALHPDAFERIVARIFENQGYEVSRISSWNQPDGGVDLLAVRRISPGIDIRVAVQCKRNVRENKVGVATVRALMGVLDVTKAHEGVVATTGFFTRNVIDEVRKHFWRISLRDYDRIVEDLRMFGLLRHGGTISRAV